MPWLLTRLRGRLGFIPRKPVGVPASAVKALIELPSGCRRIQESDHISKVALNTEEPELLPRPSSTGVPSVQVGTLQTSNSTLQSQVGTLQTSNTALQSQVTTLQNQLTVAQPVLALAPFVSVDPNPEINVTGPNIVFKGANIHIISGSGATDDHLSTGGTLTGLGDLIIGYDELFTNSKGVTQTPNRGGSHNLVIGRFNNFTSSAFGGLVAGEQNTISAEAASVSGGAVNTASGTQASVSGGGQNSASAALASVSGGSGTSSSRIQDQRTVHV